MSGLGGNIRGKQTKRIGVYLVHCGSFIAIMFLVAFVQSFVYGLTLECSKSY